MGDPWSNEELKASLEVYLEMLEKQQLETPYVKTRYYRDLSEKYGRTEKAFEYRMQNISFLFSTLGREWLKGLPPAKNVGTNVKEKLHELLIEIETGDDKNLVVSTLSASISKENGPAMNEKTKIPGHNPTIDSLLKKGHGGSEAAAVPGDSSLDNLPTGDPAPGWNEIEIILTEEITSSKKEKNIHWIFLTGSPGNGKSLIVQKLINELDQKVLRDRRGQIAQRKYIFPNPSKNDYHLEIINDATIREKENGIGDLAHDLKGALKKSAEIPTFLVVNINRGILIEELNYLDSASGWETEKKIIKIVHENKKGSYYERHEIPLNDKTISIHALYLDQVSLLEKRPIKNGKTIQYIGDEAQPTDYEVMRFDDEGRHESPAGKLIDELVEKDNFEGKGCEECSANELCPFLSNARNLRNDKFRLGFLQVLRGLEIISGHLITYRDLWGILKTAILGRTSKEWDSMPCKWVCQKVNEWKADEKKNKKSLMELIVHRIHHGLFPNELKTDVLSYRVTNDGEKDYINTLMLDHVDPSLDVNREWASNPSDALEGMHLDQPPIESVALQSIQPYWSDLDKQVERLLLEDDAWKEDDVTRRHVLHWWGSSLYRFYGLAVGRPANLEVINEWVRLRRKSVDEYSGQDDDKNLARGLTELFCPSSGLDSAKDSCLIPIFHHRSEPIRAETEPTWVFKVSTDRRRPTWHLRFSGDAIWIDIKHSDQNKLICSMLLDFTLCREAMSSANGLGFTELGERAMPRLERARSALIADPTSRNTIGIASSKFHKLESI